MSVYFATTTDVSGKLLAMALTLLATGVCEFAIVIENNDIRRMRIRFLKIWIYKTGTSPEKNSNSTSLLFLDDMRMVYPRAV